MPTKLIIKAKLTRALQHLLDSSKAYDAGCVVIRELLLSMPKSDTKELVIGVCNAYEQAYGQGYDKRSLSNPYTRLSDEWEAWDYGYSEGNRKRITHDKNNKDSEAH